MQSAQQNLHKARLNLQNKLKGLDAKKKSEEAQTVQKCEMQKLREASQKLAGIFRGQGGAVPPSVPPSAQP